MPPLRLWCLGLIACAASSTAAQVHNDAPLTSVEQRIDGATKGLGFFERSRRYDFDGILSTLLEINGDDSGASPFDARWDVRAQQIQNAFAAWFLVFRTIDGLKRDHYDPLVKANQCHLNIAPVGGFAGMDPNDVRDPQQRAAYQRALDENFARCDRNDLQMILPRLDEHAQEAFHKFLQRLSPAETPDGSGETYFAFALANGGLQADRIEQMWKIFGNRRSSDWKPTISYDSTANAGAPEFAFSEAVTSSEARRHSSEWLHSGDPRKAAWAAHFAVRDRQTQAIPSLLAYVHTRLYT
jgi:hypothetical protein